MLFKHVKLFLYTDSDIYVYCILMSLFCIQLLSFVYMSEGFHLNNLLIRICMSKKILHSFMAVLFIKEKSTWPTAAVVLNQRHPIWIHMVSRGVWVEWVVTVGVNRVVGGLKRVYNCGRPARSTVFPDHC